MQKNLRKLKQRMQARFGGLHVVFAGDFRQLDPVKGIPLYMSNCSEFHEWVNCYIELEGMHRFRDDVNWGMRSCYAFVTENQQLMTSASLTICATWVIKLHCPTESHMHATATLTGMLSTQQRLKTTAFGVQDFLRQTLQRMLSSFLATICRSRNLMGPIRSYHKQDSCDTGQGAAKTTLR